MSTPATWLIVLAVMHTACSGTPSPVGPPTRPSKHAGQASAASSVPETSAITPLGPPVDYAARGRRDPFTPVRNAGEPGPDRSILRSARLTGIVRGAGGALALVEAIDGTGFILRAGESFGDGRLLAIGEDFALFAVGSGSAAAMPTRVVLRLEPTP